MRVRVTWGGNMFKNSKLVSFPLVAVPLLVGCDASIALVSEEITASREAFSPVNPPTGSIIFTNSLEPEALMPNDLGVHSLDTMSATTVALLSGPDGTLLRELLNYAVGCALDEHARVEVVWTDGNGHVHRESYRGQLGLAPDWQTRPLHVVEQEWVTACLAARTNWSSERMRISMRGNAQGLGNANGEANQFPIREGAFWGNLFSAVPYVRACYDSANVAYARAQGRECSAGHPEAGAVVECGLIHVVGPCDDACAPTSTAGHYTSCRIDRTDLPNNAQTARVITVFLR